MDRLTSPPLRRATVYTHPNYYAQIRDFNKASPTQRRLRPGTHSPTPGPEVPPQSCSAPASPVKGKT